MAQTAIGWNQVFKGRISEQWSALYNHEIQTRYPLEAHKYPADRWGKKSITLAVQYALDAWQIWNDIEHDTKGNPNATAKMKLIEKILWSIDQIGQGITTKKSANYGSILRCKEMEMAD
jgi:hypothetical protein